MNKNSVQNLEWHINVLGWLSIITNVFVLFVMGFVMLLLFGAGILSGDAEAIGIMAFIALIIGGIMLMFSIPGIVAGWGLLKGKKWARTLALIMGVLNIMNFPIGTAVGMYTIYVLLLHEESEQFFNTPKFA